MRSVRGYSFPHNHFGKTVPEQLFVSFAISTSMPKSVIYRSLIIVTKSSLVNTFPWICAYRNKKPPCCDFSGEDGSIYPVLS